MQAPGEELEELIAWARAQLGLNEDTKWRLISTRKKLKKTFFEIEETRSGGTTRIVGKVSRSDRSANAFVSLGRVWEAGFRPPSLYTVVRPVAYLKEKKLLLQEKASGTQLLDAMRRHDAASPEMACRAARWLAALHHASIEAAVYDGEPHAVERCRAELPAELPASAARIDAIADRLVALFADRDTAESVPSHGDFHPMNVFVRGDGRVTVIDFDTFSRRERAADVAYFLAQAAIMGYLDTGGFEQTRNIRAAFHAEYRRTCRCRLDPRRLGMYMAFAFLQSLHFERCILHTNNNDIVEPWLSAVEQCLEGNPDV